MIEIDPATTAADLRNAAMIIDMCGHGTGYYVSPDKGTVCLDGALKLATDSKLHRTDRNLAPPHRSVPVILWTWADIDPAISEVARWTLSLRYEAAVEALASLLPDVCTCGTFDDGTPGPEDCGFNASRLRIQHYSDFVCDGGEEAIALCIEVAEKIEADL